MYTNDQPQVIFKSLEYSIRELYIYLGKYSEYLSIDKKKCLRNSKTIKIYKQKKRLAPNRYQPLWLKNIYLESFPSNSISKSLHLNFKLALNKTHNIQNQDTPNPVYSKKYGNRCIILFFLLKNTKKFCIEI